MASLFNFDKALVALKDDPFAKKFLTDYRPMLEDVGVVAAKEIAADLAEGQDRKALELFFHETGPETLAQGAVDDVLNTADMASRAKKFHEDIDKWSAWAANALLSALVAGFLV